MTGGDGAFPPTLRRPQVAPYDVDQHGRALMRLSDEIMTDIGHLGAAVGADTYRHSATPSNDASTSYATSPRRDQIASRQPGG